MPSEIEVYGLRVDIVDPYWLYHKNIKNLAVSIMDEIDAQIFATFSPPSRDDGTTGT